MYKGAVPCAVIHALRLCSLHWIHVRHATDTQIHDSCSTPATDRLRVFQLLLGAPFLIHHPMAYLARSFEVGRVFKFEWTVNFKFLDEEAFVSPVLSVALLVSTIAALALFAAKWMRSSGQIRDLAADNRSGGHGAGAGTDMLGHDSWGGDRHLLPEYVVKTLFVSNFIGVVFCRSLHYQVTTAIMHDVL